MRDIKFRQYLTDKKVMLSWEDLLNQEHEDSETIEAMLTEKFSNASPPMQYTGLKDKNGKEIYEGDICHLGSLDVHTVVFHRTAFCLDGIKHGLTLDGCYYLGNCVREKLEVIGNIYENPELLKEPKP